MSADTPKRIESQFNACIYKEHCLSLKRELAQARAECEQLRQEMREYEHHVMTGRNEQHDRLVAETERLRAEVEAMIDKFYERMTSMKALLDQGSYHMVAAKLIADISALEAARAKP